MQLLLEIKDYNTAWLMGHKVCGAMGETDTRFSFGGLIELNDSFWDQHVVNQGEGMRGRAHLYGRCSYFETEKEKEGMVLHIFG